MTARAAKTVLALLTAGALSSVVACSSDAGERPSDPVLGLGYDVYTGQCAQCHGAGGGGGLGPGMEGVADRLTVEEHTTVVVEGRDGTSMPAFGDRLSTEEIEAVVRYEREELG